MRRDFISDATIPLGAFAYVSGTPARASNGKLGDHTGTYRDARAGMPPYGMQALPIPWDSRVERLLLDVVRNALTRNDFARAISAGSAWYMEQVQPLLSVIADKEARQGGTGTLLSTVRSSHQAIAAAAVSAHLVWLRGGCHTVDIDAKALGQLRRAGPVLTWPEPPLSDHRGAHLGGLVRFTQAPLEFLPNDPRLPPIRATGFYWEGVEDEHGVWRVSVHLADKTGPQHFALLPTMIYVWSEPWWEVVDEDTRGYTNFTGMLMRILSTIWASPETRPVPIQRRSDRCARPSQAWDGSAVRLTLNIDPSLPPERRQFVEVAPALPPEHIPQADAPPPEEAARAGKPLDRLVSVRTYEKRVWVCDTTATTEELESAIRAGRVRETTHGTRYGVLRTVLGHQRGPLEGARPPKIRLTRIVGSGETL